MMQKLIIVVLQRGEKMDDLINRQDAIEAVQNRHIMLNKEKVLLINDLEKLPSAEPQIIRCKDCKHRDKYGCCKYWKGLAMVDIPIATDDNDFCSYAEQR